MRRSVCRQYRCLCRSMRLARSWSKSQILMVGASLQVLLRYPLSNICHQLGFTGWSVAAETGAVALSEESLFCSLAPCTLFGASFVRSAGQLDSSRLGIKPRLSSMLCNVTRSVSDFIFALHSCNIPETRCCKAGNLDSFGAALGLLTYADLVNQKPGRRSLAVTRQPHHTSRRAP